MIYILEVGYEELLKVKIAIESPTFNEALQHITNETVKMYSGTVAIWFRGAYETWKGACVAEPLAHPLPLSSEEFMGKDEVERHFDWPLSDAEVQEHFRQWDEGTGIYAPGLPEVMRFKRADEQSMTHLAL